MKNFALVFYIIWFYQLKLTISQCPSRCFCQLLEKPRTVDCTDSDLMAFPDNIDSMVQKLILSNNVIAVIPNNINNYLELSHISVSGNKIQSISTSFQGIINLQYLDISKNFISDLSQINANTFIKENYKLTLLNLSGNQISNLGTKTQMLKSYLASPSLEILDLSHCKINSISEEVLNELPKLKYLDLSWNPIKWMRNLHSQSLVHLDLSNGQLDYISHTELRQLPSLKNLSVSGNSELDISNLMSVTLSHFEAAYCRLTIPGLKNMPNLQFANLKGNKITKLPSNSFVNNAYLKELDLSENLIDNIEKSTFYGLEYLERLNLARNSIYGSLPQDSFAQNKYLKVLNISNNYIRTFYNFKNPSLKFLDVSQCEIEVMYKDSLKYLPWLTELNLSNNPLENFPDDIFSVSLSHLDLSYCRLTTIGNGTFRGLSQLTSLNLEGNRFTEPIKAHILHNLTRLHSIWIGNNPWSCNCQSNDFKELWFYLSDARNILKSDAKCQTPETLRGVSWRNACYLEWYPDPDVNRSIFDHYGVIVLISIFSIAALLFLILTIRKRVVSIKSRQEDLERENHLQNLERLRRSRESVNSHRDGDITVNLRESPHENRPRQVSLPPPYDEAILLPRLRASQEELEDGSRTAAQQQQVTVEISERRRISNVSSSTVDSLSPSNSHSDTGESSESEDEFSEEQTGEHEIKSHSQRK